MAVLPRSRLKTIGLLLLLSMMFLSATTTAQAGGLEPGTPEYVDSLLKDWSHRSSLPQAEVPRSEWYTPRMLKSLWGPMPARYPGIEETIASLPPGTNHLHWKRDRVVAVAKHYIGIPYRHHHIPAWSPSLPEQPLYDGPGLDCSNFTAWVYNIGFGVLLNSDVAKQAAMEPRPGFSRHPGMRNIGAEGPFQPGDILYIANPQKTEIVHAVIYIDNEHIIDSTDGQVAIRHFTGWYRNRLSHAIRVFNE